jgi:hypothetical protein
VRDKVLAKYGPGDERSRGEQRAQS